MGVFGEYEIVYTLDQLRAIGGRIWPSSESVFAAARERAEVSGWTHLIDGGIWREVRTDGPVVMHVILYGNGPDA